MEINPRPADVKVVCSPCSRSGGIEDNEVLIEGHFIELDAKLQFVRDVYIFVCREFVYVKEEGTRRELMLAHMLQHGSRKDLSKFSRSDVNIKVKEGCFRTLKAKWGRDAGEWKIYEMCKKDDEELWLKWLRFFGVMEQTSSRILPPLAVNEVFADSSSESDSSGDEDDAAPMPFRALTLSVDRAISSWSMSMLNPSTVRKLTLAPAIHSSIGTLGSENEDSIYALELESIFRSNSIPRLAQSRSYRSPSLPNLAEMNTACVNVDLRRISDSKPKATPSGVVSTNDPSDSCTTSSSSEVENRFAADLVKESPKNILLQQKIESLRAQPSDLNFVKKGRPVDATLDVLMSPFKRRLSFSVAMNNEANRIPLAGESSAGDQITIIPGSPPPEGSDFHTSSAMTSSNTSEQPNLVSGQLDFDDDTAVGTCDPDQIPQTKFRRIWTRLSKRKPKLPSTASWSPSDGTPNRTQDTKQNSCRKEKSEDLGARKATSYVMANIRRGGVGDSISGEKEGVLLSCVTKPESTGESVPSPVCNKPEKYTEVTPLRKTSLLTTGSTKKKLVKKILSPIFKSTSMDDGAAQRRLSVSGEVALSSEFLNTSTGELLQRLVDIDAMTFAREITLIDKVLLVKIPWEELATCGWMTKDKHLRSPNVMAMVEFFNRIALLVASEILSESSPALRALVIARVIQIAAKCRRLGNFNSLKALLAGLQSTPIFRLHETWKEVPSKSKKKFRRLSILMGEEDNFAAYRAELDNFRGACIPFLGNVLTQIAQAHAYASIRRKRQKRLKESSPGRKTSADEMDGTKTKGVKECNGVISRQSEETTPQRPVSPRDMYKRHARKEPQGKSRERTPKSSSRAANARRKYGRCSSDNGVLMIQSQTSSTELLNTRDERLDRTLNLSRSDSVIANVCSLEEEENSPCLARPSLVRRLSESASSTGSINGKSRRLSEMSRTSFIKNLVKRSQSSHSVNVSRKPSWKLSHSVSAHSVKDGYVLSRETFVERLTSVKSSPSGMSRDLLAGEAAQASGRSGLSTRSRGTSIASEGTSGTDNRLWEYQLAAIEYDFPTRPGVKHFLLNANFNTEEDNYRLSLKREQPIKKT